MPPSLVRLGLATAAALVLLPSMPAHAEVQVGGWVGGRFFSDNQLLGFNPENPQGSPHRTLRNGVVFGARIGVTLSEHLVPEIELPLSVATVQQVGSQVIWFAPRAQLRLEMLPGSRVAPFVVLGGGPTIAISSDQNNYKSSIQGNGYIGIGVGIQVRRNLRIRFDARLSFDPGLDPIATVEGEFGLGVVVPLGVAPAAGGSTTVIAPNADADGDGVRGTADACPTRPEDKDDFEDTDGCPDIDNDLDRVLDDVDQCATVPESANGYLDDDGCPDAVPDEVTALLGPIAGITFAAGEATLPADAAARLAPLVALLATQPSIKLILVGHGAIDDVEITDEQAEAGEDGAEPVRALSVARAKAVETALYKLGVNRGRLDTDGKGFDEPLEGKTTRANLARTHRVELKLFVPAR